MTPITAYNERDIIDSFSRVKKLSYRQFKEWLLSYGKAAYQMGLAEGENEGAWWSDDEIFQILREERIGAEKARRIIEKLLEREGVENGGIENL